MSVSIERTTPRGATVVWDSTDDTNGYVVEAIDSGRLEAALTALGLKAYDELAALRPQERAELLRHTARLANELTRRVRHLTVAARDIDGASWSELAHLLVDDTNARGTARSTYAAGLRQMGRTPADVATEDDSTER
jgi:acyl-CoA reductase-like NAD-dependent aldehyde dehydrogenase